jgi:hypothetical protein
MILRIDLVALCQHVAYFTIILTVISTKPPAATKTKVVKDEWRRKPRGRGLRRSRMLATKLLVQNRAAQSSDERALSSPKEMMKPGKQVDMRSVTIDVLAGCSQSNLDTICC